jgi:hypothetical protein|tara:strand:+ start:327 stop:524 length:198 start_codon:yes stop_codon:yes gene_type:complete
VDGIRLTEHFLKKIRTRQAEISETLMSGGISSLEQYQNLMGQVSALGFMEQELTALLNRTENDDD